MAAPGGTPLRRSRSGLVHAPGRRSLGSASWLGGGVLLLLRPLGIAAWMVRFEWMIRPHDTAMPWWRSTADQVGVASIVALALCTVSAACFVIAGLRDGIAESAGRLVAGLLLVGSVAGLCVAVGVVAAQLTRAWASLPR